MRVLTLGGKLGRQRLLPQARSAGPVAAAAAAERAVGRGSSLRPRGWHAIDTEHPPERSEDDNKQQEAGSPGFPGQAAAEPVLLVVVLLGLHGAQLATLGVQNNNEDRLWNPSWTVHRARPSAGLIHHSASGET